MNDLNAIMYDGGTGGEYIFKILVHSSNSNLKDRYKSSFHSKENKIICTDCTSYLFHEEFISNISQLFFNLPTTFTQNINNNLFNKLFEISLKLWYHKTGLYLFETNDIKKLDIKKLRAIDKLPDVNIDEPLWMKGHYNENKIPKKYSTKIVNLAWPESKRKILTNMQLKKIGVDPIKINITKFWNDKKYELDENKLIINSYYLIIEPKKDLWNKLADFFNITNNFNWEQIEKFANKNKELYDK